MSPAAPAAQKPSSQAVVPMWDSSDPARYPPPLPLNPGNPGSPRTVGPLQHPLATPAGGNTREVSPIRRPQVPPHKEGSPSAGPNISPTRAQQVISSHRRMGSVQPSPTVREMGNLLLSGGSTSPSRNATPTPKELFGSSTSFPARDQMPTPAPGYRGSLDLDRLPNLLPPLRNSKEGTPPPNPNNALTAPREFGGFKEFNLPPLPRERDRDEWGRDRDREREDGPKFSIHDLETVTSQLSGLTSIANSLQREMTNLSRRSKDNATDLISLKEATKSRDEDIRQSLRDLVHGLHTIESDRLLANSSIPLITSGASTSSRSSSYASDNYVAPPGTRGIDKSGLEMAALERILREMSTKDEQDRVIDLLRDVQDTINKPQLESMQNEEKILSLLEEFKEREYARGKELTIPGEVRDRGMDEQILSMLEHIRQSVYEKEEREGDKKILGLLEELKEKGENARVISLLEELREREGDSKINVVLSSLEELKERGGDERVISLLEEIKTRMDSMKEALINSPSSVAAPRDSTQSQDASGSEPAWQPTQTSDILSALKGLKEGVDSGEETAKDIRELLDEWKEKWAGHDKEAHAALKDLMKEIEILVTEQRHAISRLHSSSGLQSTALTMANPPLPPDLDNEAAITALANIASTTTRTDITLSSINALIKVFHKDMNAANSHTHESMLSVSRFLKDLGDTMMNANSQAGETRKTLEVVRSGVSSGNDRLAEFEGATLRKIEELMYLHKHLQRTMLNSGDELVWKQDVGVRAVVEEFQSEVEELLEKNLEAVKESTEATVDAVNNSNPASIIADLKRELGAMAERSLAAFAAADSREALAELKAELKRATEQSIESINSSDPRDSIEKLRTEVKELLERNLAAVEFGSGKVVGELAKIGEAAPTRAAIGDLQSQLEELVKGSFRSYSGETSTALAGLKSAIVDKPDGSEKIQASIDQLKAGVTELMEKSMTALAPPTTYPEAETIKARIGALAHEITKAMDNTIALFSDSSVETDEKLKKAVDELKADLSVMERSILETVSSNSASGLVGVMKDALEEMRKVVAEQIEKNTEASEKSLASSVEVSEKMADAIVDLRKEVSEMVEKSIDMAVGTANSESSTRKVQEAIEGLRSDISNVIDNSFIAVSSSDNAKAVLEDLRKDVAEMIEKSMSMIVAPSGSDGETKELLGAIKKDIADILQKTPSSPPSSIHDVKEAIADLRKEIGDMMNKSVSMIVPRTADATEAPSGPAENIEKVLSDLKSEISEMVQHSLAAAIANSTFDSEESVKEAIEELKRDVRDTLQLSMMPLPADNTEGSDHIRVVIQGLKNDLGRLFETKIAEPNTTIMEGIDGLRTQVRTLVENSERGDLNGTMEELKMQVEQLAEKGPEEGVVEAVEELKKGMDALAEKLEGSSEENMASTLEGLKKEVEGLSGKSMGALEALKIQVEGLDVKDAIEALKSQVEGLSGTSGAPPPPGSAGVPKGDDIKDSMEALKRDIEEVMERSMGSLVASKPDDTEVREWIGALKEEMVVYVEKSLQAVKDANPSEAIEGLRRDVREAMHRSGHHIPHEPERTQVGEKVEKIKEAFEELRKVVEKNSGTDPATRSSLEERMENMKSMTSGLKQALSAFRAEEKESVADISSAVGECRVEVAVVKTLVEEKHTEVKDSMTGFATAVDESHAELKDSISAVQEVVEGLKTTTKEDITSLAGSVVDLGAETKNIITGLNLSLSENHTETKQGISGVGNAVSDLHLELKEGIASIGTGISETKEEISSINQGITGSTLETKEAIERAREAVETAKTETREGLGVVGKAVGRTGTEVKEAVAGLGARIEASQSNISEVKASIEESQVTVRTTLADISASVEGRADEVRDDVFAVKKAVEESSATATHEHHKTQKQVEDVLGLVDGLQSDIKGQQPALSNALLELKHLLEEAHKEIAKKPDVEPLPPPPAYDDSQTQQKLNTLIAGNSSIAKYLPQLNLLGSIQKQVSTTSADIAEFLSMQKEVLLEDASSKIDAARQAEMDLEKATAERRIMEAATASLREEQANLQDSIESLKEESQALYARKLKLTGKVASLETALDLRRDELMLLEARAEGLERRVIEGVIEQSRVLLMKSKGNGSRMSEAAASATLRKIHHSPVVKSGSNGRRNLSLNEIQNETPTSSKSGRASLSGSTLGLGQKEYSASLGLLKRSQSTRSVGSSDRRQGSWGQRIGRVFSSSGGKESDGVPPVREEEADEYDPDEDMDVDAELERLMRGQVESGLEDGRRSSSGSVRRMSADDGEEEGDEGVSRSRTYPGLDLDFSDEPMGRSISGISNRA